MAVSLKQPVHGGAEYSVRFTNDLGSTGVVLVLVGWVPNQQANVPDPEQVIVAPGATATIEGVVPSEASTRRMTVVVDLDPGESGTLELLENDQSHSVEAITETTTWKMLVI